MAQTMSEPMYEINPESDYYKKSKAVRDAKEKIYKIIDAIAAEYEFNPNDFPHYPNGTCGFLPRTEGFKKFQDEVKKNPDRNGVHTFKKTSKMWKEIKPEMDKIAAYWDLRPEPWDMITIVGMNNCKATQWVDERLFVGVRDKEQAERSLADPQRKKNLPIEPLMEVEYKEYLQYIINILDEVKADEKAAE